MSPDEVGYVDEDNSTYIVGLWKLAAPFYVAAGFKRPRKQRAAKGLKIGTERAVRASFVVSNDAAPKRWRMVSA